MALSLSLFLVLSMICGAVLGECGIGAYKPYHGACDCSNRCLGNSHCLRNEEGGAHGATICQCLPCMYFDEDMNQCIYTPGFGEPCTTTCKSNVGCYHGKCACAPDETYDGESCVPNFDCADTCAGRVNGDYQACGDLCKEGYFITCSNGLKHVMPCAAGFYINEGVRFVNRTVFDPVIGRCEFASPSCPRPQDDQVIA